jgi:pimeloyl-ACP methyl ester carboxylesterase/LysM repeat protein
MTKRVTLIATITILLAILSTVVVVSAPPAATTGPLAQTGQTPTAEPAPPPAPGDIRYIPCPMNLPEGEVDGETVLCGQVIVPENWDEAGGQTAGSGNALNITYAILKAKSGAPFAEPIIYLEGGPGGSALEDIEKLSDFFSKLRETRDLIMYDQRGTDYSSNLDCPLAVQAKPIADAMKASQESAASKGQDAGSDSADGQAAGGETTTEAKPTPKPTPVPYLDRDPQEVLDEQRSAGNPTETGCRDYFEEQGVDLSAYTTASSTRDLIALMQALDYDVYNIYGISYGSRLGLELLRTYEEPGAGADLPEIRSVVIDGIDPPNIDIITQSPFGTMYITLRTLSDCEAEEACGAAYPDIRQRAVDLLAQAQEAPLEIASSDGITATVPLEALTGILTGATVTDGEDHTPIGYAEVIPYMPRLVAELSSGVGDTYMGLKQGLLPPAAAPETQDDFTVFDPLALRSQRLSDEAEAMSEELAMLSAQAQRASDALTSHESLPEFFTRELIHLVSEQPSFKALGAVGQVHLLIKSAQEPNRETLVALIDLFDLDDVGVATLHGIANLMSDEDVAETIKLVLSDRVVEQLAEPFQRQMNTAVLCNDMYSKLDVESGFEIYRNAEAPQLLRGMNSFVGYISRCERYNLTPETGESDEPVVNEVSILVVSGGIDAITPVEWGESAAEHLPNAQLVTIPMYGHGATAKSECGQDIVRYFFTYPEHKVNTACIDDLKPRFVLPGEEQSKTEDADAAEQSLLDAAETAAAGAAVESNLNLTARRGGGVYDRGPNSHASGTFRTPHYAVARGDTLYSVGNRFGVTPRQIARANGLPSNSISAGQVLIIPGAQGGGPDRPPTSGHYERVRFAPGATDWSGTGVIRSAHPKGYILSASRGQTLEINTQSHGEPLHVILERADGRKIRLNGENNGISNHLFTTLPATGDYIVIVKPTATPESPNLQFGITFIIL